MDGITFLRQEIREDSIKGNRWEFPRDYLSVGKSFYLRETQGKCKGIIPYL